MNGEPTSQGDWRAFTQSVTVMAGWMIGWTALLILYASGWL
ncbi:MAG: hypothetical protein U1E83_10570 [Methylotetracoccus sp.]